MDRFLTETGEATPAVEIPQPKRTDMSTTNDIVVFTDGSALNNGKSYAKGGYAIVFPYQAEYSQSFRMPPGNVTNNRAEYLALIRAFEVAETMDPLRSRRLVVYTDSNLLIQSVTKWIVVWKRKGWRKADGKPVLNRDLLERLDKFMSLRGTVFHHVEAHTGRTDWVHHWNDVADKMARDAATSHT